MKNFYVLAILFFLSVLITSCTKETVDSGMNPNVVAQSRTAQNVYLSMTTTVGTKVNVAVESASIGNVSSGTFTVNTEGQTYVVTTLSATHQDDGLKVIANESAGQVIYEDKSATTITVENGMLRVAMSPSVSIIEAYSIVIEEMDGI